MAMNGTDRRLRRLEGENIVALPWHLPFSRLSISLETGLIRSFGAAHGSRGCTWAHIPNTSEFVLSRVQAPSAPRACRPRC